MYVYMLKKRKWNTIINFTTTRLLYVPSLFNPEHQGWWPNVILWYLEHELNFHLQWSCLRLTTFIPNLKQDGLSLVSCHHRVVSYQSSYRSDSFPTHSWFLWWITPFFSSQIFTFLISTWKNPCWKKFLNLSFSCNLNELSRNVIY